MSKNINMKREDQIKFQELINKKQMWIKRAVDEINTNGTDEGYKRAVSYISFDAGINIDLEKLLLKYYKDENIEEIKVTKNTSEYTDEINEADEADESTYEDVKVEEEQDNV